MNAIAWLRRSALLSLLLASPAFAQEPPESAPSRYGRPLSARWALGAEWRRANLAPVPNPNPAPEPQPRRDHPYDLALSADGARVYVTLLGSELEPGSELAVIDVASGRVLRRIPLLARGADGPPASGPYRIALHPGGRFLLVTHRFSNFVSVVDTRTDEVVAEIPLDFYAQGLAFDAAGRTAWVANRYLDQVLELDLECEGDIFHGRLRERPGLDAGAFLGSADRPGLHALLARSCGTAGCHDLPRGGFVAGADAQASLSSALEHVVAGRPDASRLLRAVTRTRHGGYADDRLKRGGHAGGTVVFPRAGDDPDHRALAAWIAAASDGPGIPVGNPRSKPKVCVLSPDGRHLFVGNTGTQDIAIVDTRLGREVAAIWVQNVVNDLRIHRDPGSGRTLLFATTMGAGFGVARERDPHGGETWDPGHAAAEFTLWRDLETGEILPRERQQVLGPYDAVDGTAAIKFRDVQNDLLVVDVGALPIPAAPPADGLRHVLLAHRYEAHRGWVRYTSDTAESTAGDVKGDLPPDLMRVVGALPEKMALVGDRLFVTLQGSHLVQEWRIQAAAAEASDVLVPVRVFATGMQPIGIAAGPAGTPAAGRLYVANFLGGTVSVIDTATGTSRELIVDASVARLPVPATNAERGEIVAHTALFSSDADTSCFHCHYFDMGDGRPWGVSQVTGQGFRSRAGKTGHLVIGGTMGVPQMRGLFAIQPFFLEGVLSVYEPRSMLMEHAPADDFARPTPQGDFTALEAHYAVHGAAEVQSGVDASTQRTATLEERREEMIRRVSLREFGKAFTLRDLQRFVGEWQAHEPRLLPTPYDPADPAVRRGKRLFEDPRVGCVSCHPPPHFARKDFPDNPQQTVPPQVWTTMRDGSFTLIGMNRLDRINGLARDLEPADPGRAEEIQGRYTTLALRGIWDRPPVFLHHGMARTLREVLCPPGHAGLRTFPYEPRIGGVPERPGRREVGFNTTALFAQPSPALRILREAGGRIGIDTHGGTSHLTAREVDDLVAYLNVLE